MDNKFLLPALMCLCVAPLAAQTHQPYLFDTFRCDQMSGNGQWMVGRSNTWLDEETGSLNQESSICNVATGEIFGLNDLFTLTPYSRPISSTGLAVLSTYDERTNWIEVPFLIVPGEEPIILEELYRTGPYAGKECYSCAITDDGSQFLGYYEEYPKQYPFVCRINPDYTIGTPEFLPLPEADIFGNTPYNVQLTAISDDALTVAGTVTAVIPGTGVIGYPIVYRKGADGSWSFHFPLADLYKDIDPSNVYDFYDTQIGLSPDGNLMVCTQEVPGEVNGYPDYVVWKIDLASDTYSVVKSANKDLIATRVLNDGTVTATFFATIKISYILAPGAEDFVDFVEYVKAHNVGYGEWMDENLMVLVYDYEDNVLVEKMMPNTGQVYVSDNLTVFGSGFQESSKYDEYYNPLRWSYVFTDFDPSSSAVKAPAASVSAGDAIYNIQGVKVGTFTDNSDLRHLAPGLYIIGGCRVLVP